MLVVIMLTSTVGYAFYSSDSAGSTLKPVEEAGIEFTRTDYGYWAFNIQGYEFETKYLPSETQEIQVLTSKTLQDYSSKPFYFGLESDNDISTLGNQEIIKNLQDFISRSNYACLGECEGDYPVKNCSDNIVAFKEESQPAVIEEDGCVFIYHTTNTTEKAADAFLYRILGLR